MCEGYGEKEAKRQGTGKMCTGTSRAEGSGTDNFYVAKDSDSESPTLFFEVRQSLFTFMEQVFDPQLYFFCSGLESPQLKRAAGRKPLFFIANDSLKRISNFMM